VNILLKDNCDIVVDTREAASGAAKGGMKIFKGLLNFPDIKVKVQNLGNHVDYSLPSKDGITHIIQRKTATEILNRNALFEDLIGMKSIPNTKPYLLLEGSLGLIQKFSHWSPEPIIGIVQSVLDDYDVKIIPSPSYYYTTKWLVVLAKRLGRTKEKKLLPLGYKVSRDMPYRERARAVLESFPNISTTLSERILSKYGTLKNSLDNVTRWHYEIEQMGEKKVMQIVAVLNAEWLKK
jgi:ERCC4-type nuclease